MGANKMVLALGFFFCWAFPLPKLSSSQKPPALAKLYIYSNPPGASIEINGAPRNDKTPVTLVVIPSTYSVKVGPCVAQSVTVASGETKEIDCPPAGSKITGAFVSRGSR
jgi:hypothetical protein